MTPEDVLAKAAEDIATYGHCKEAYQPKGHKDEMTAPACAYGAMTRAATGRTTCYAYQGQVVGQKVLVDQAALLLSETIRKQVVWAGEPWAGEPWDIVTAFNDADRTTGEDVALMMKKAAHGGS